MACRDTLQTWTVILSLCGGRMSVPESGWSPAAPETSTVEPFKQLRGCEEGLVEVTQHEELIILCRCYLGFLKHKSLSLTLIVF